MEKKSIGGFISALRKANGMTQKELAERLNVSDKTVSRWECDEGAPDLSLIPVIAEIFGVTCDELLRGERKSPEQRDKSAAAAEPSPKAEKQLYRILKTAMSQYRTRTCIAVGVSVVGLIAAQICSLVFSKVMLGFLLGSVFFAVSVVCQVIFLNRALFSVEGEEFRNLPELNESRRKIIRLTEFSVGLTVLFAGFTLPPVFLDPYYDLTASRILLWEIIGMAVSLVIYAVALWFLNARLLKKGVYVLSEKEAQAYPYNHRLQRILVIVLAVLLAVTAFVQEVSTSLYWITEKTTFDDYESFVKFMEMDIPDYRYDGHSVSEIIKDGTETYRDVYGNEISEDEFRRNTLLDKDWNVLCEFVHRNGLVARTEFSDAADLLPITVYYYEFPTESELIERDLFFDALYCAEVVSILLIYAWKRRRVNQ